MLFGVLSCLSAAVCAQSTDLPKAPPKARKLLGSGPGDEPATGAPKGMAGTVDELRAYRMAVDARAYGAAREAGEDLLERDEGSFVALYVLGLAHHFGEGNLPRAAWYLEQCLEVFYDEEGDDPDSDVALWEAHALVALAKTYSQLGRSEEAIEKYREHDRKFPGEVQEKISTVWPLMQMRRFDEALKVAHSILRDASTTPGDRAVALNGYVAVLFERGDRQEAHKWALELTTEFPDSPTFWANASETARGLMKLEQSERLSLESAKRGVADFAQPFVDLAEVRIRRGRLSEAYAALRSDRAYRQQRPAYLEQQGAAAARRTLAELMLINNDPEGALKLTERAVVQPDRSGGKSRDIRQDLATSALLERRAQLDRAAQIGEHADLLGGPRLVMRASALRLRAEAWASRNRSQSILHDNELLIGMIAVGGPRGVALSTWLVPELIDIVGPGIFYNAVRRARRFEREDRLTPYFSAFAAEAERALGHDDAAVEMAEAALDRLPDQEIMLRLRLEAVIAETEMDHDLDRSLERLERIMATDPTLLRRLDIPLPLREPPDEASRQVFELLLGTDRYAEREDGFMPLVDGEQTCLVAPSGARGKCVTDKGAEEDVSPEEHLRTEVVRFHDRVMRPNVSINVAGLRSLDGSNTTPSGGNRGLRELAK